MTLLPRSPLLASILLLGCVPPPESLGEGLDTDTGSSADEGIGSGSSAGSVSADGTDESDEIDPEPKWELVFDEFTMCTDLALTPDGGVAVLLAYPDADGFIAGRELHRYAADGTLLWQWADGTDLVDVTTLPDGRMLIGGGTSPAQRQAALWLLAPDGGLEASYVQPLDGTQDEALVRSVAASSSNVAFVIVHMDSTSPTNDPTRYETGLAGLDLVPQWSTPEVDAKAEMLELHSVQLTASESIRTLQFEFEMEMTRMRTYSTTGVLESDAIVSPMLTFAAGEPGVLIGYDDAGLHVQGLQGATFGQLLFAESFDSFPVGYHHDGLLIGGSAPESLGVRILRLDIDGTQRYTRTLAPIEGPYAYLHNAVPGPEESVYLCGTEFDENATNRRAFVSRRYPLW
jgi:hypothetical protein